MEQMPTPVTNGPEGKPKMPSAEKRDAIPARSSVMETEPQEVKVAPEEGTQFGEPMPDLGPEDASQLTSPPAEAVQEMEGGKLTEEQMRKKEKEMSAVAEKMRAKWSELKARGLSDNQTRGHSEYKELVYQYEALKNDLYRAKALNRTPELVQKPSKKRKIMDFFGF